MQVNTKAMINLIVGLFVVVLILGIFISDSTTTSLTNVVENMTSTNTSSSQVNTLADQGANMLGYTFLAIGLVVGIGFLYNGLKEMGMI